MRELMTNRDIGSAINFRALLGEAAHYQAQHPWPAETIVSAGRGVVFRRTPKEGETRSYSTLFMEVYPPGAAFIRGEGDSPQACEDAAWAKYQRALHCSDGSGTHDWEPRDYHNGAAFCSRCNTFGSKIFSGEQLGQLCMICNIGTTYSWHKNEITGNQEFLCEEHYEKHQPSRRTPSNHPLTRLLERLAEDPEEHESDPGTPPTKQDQNLPSERNTMTTETTSINPVTAPKITVWTTENSEAVMWGTHNLAEAKRAYAAEHLDTEPHWGGARRMWAAPHLVELEVWDKADYGNMPEDGWIPYLVCDY